MKNKLYLLHEIDQSVSKNQKNTNERERRGQRSGAKN